MIVSFSSKIYVRVMSLKVLFAVIKVKDKSSWSNSISYCCLRLNKNQTYKKNQSCFFHFRSNNYFSFFSKKKRLIYSFFFDLIALIFKTFKNNLMNHSHVHSKSHDIIWLYFMIFEMNMNFNFFVFSFEDSWNISHFDSARCTYTYIKAINYSLFLIFMLSI